MVADESHRPMERGTWGDSMMTRKDYILVSRILNDNIEHMHPAAFSKLVEDFVDMMQDDNPRFEYGRFLEACYA